jgi:hypothetical protein
MSTRPVRLSAVVSAATKARLEGVARASGLERDRIVEEALAHHLQALAALPADVRVSPRLVVDRKTGASIRKRIAQPAEPTEAMRELFAP